jgi:ferredoxin
LTEAIQRAGPNPTFANPRFDKAAAKVLVVRLSPYEDVDRSASHLFLASEVRRAEAASFVDFAFLPRRRERERLREAGAPLLFGIESGRPFADFDIVLVSNSFALELLNLPYLLLQSGIPAYATERDGRLPPIVLGGSNAFASQSVVGPDGTAIPDVIFFGEGEGHLERFLRTWLGNRSGAKLERLERAAEGSDGFWVTGKWPERHIRQAVARPVDPQPPAIYPILDSETAGTVRLQTTYGCPAFCSFCFEGFERKPYREMPCRDLLNEARTLKSLGGVREVEVDGFNLNTYAGMAPLLCELARLFDRVSFKSQRVDILAEEPDLIALELACGKRSFTLGIEGISERMRAFLNKSLDEPAVEKVLFDLLTRRVRELKLFYLLTGHENEADLREFNAFCGRLAAPGRSSGPRIIFSFGFLVRMPNTPLRYDRLILDREPLNRLAARIKSSCESHGMEFRLASSWTEYVAGQALVAAGHELTEVVVQLAKDGVCYDGQLAPETAERLHRALRPGKDEARPVVFSEKTVDAQFPFGFVERVVSDSFLYRQFQRSKAMRDTGYCLGQKCQRCGACVSASERTAILKRPRGPIVRRDQVETLDELTRKKSGLPTIYFRARLPATFSGVGPEWAGAVLMRILLTARPGLTEVLLSVEDALFGHQELRKKFPIMPGETVIGVRGWDAGALARELAGLSVSNGACGELTVGEAVELFSPGRFKSAVLTFELSGDLVVATDALCKRLREEEFAFTRRRDGGAWVLDVAPARRKAGLIAGRVEEKNGTVRAKLMVNQRFDATGCVVAVQEESSMVVTITCGELVLSGN